MSAHGSVPLARLLPPSDLLTRVEGIDRGLQRGKRVRDIGRLAFVVSAVEVLVLTFTSGWWSDLASFDGSSLTKAWPLALGVAVVVVSLLFINWTRLWVAESRRPFRYTYSIDGFEAVEGTEPEPRLAWLRDDLARRLSERIGRLALLDKRYSEKVEPRDSHIHVGGSYGVRWDSAGRCSIEVMPWIRLGPPGEPASLAHPVKFELPLGADELRSDEGPSAYEKLVERIYFSIASELYNQIRQDVQRKIELLPRRYYRAAAYYFEAEDYLRSNTLEAYQAARELYAAVIRLYDPSWGGMANARGARLLQRVDGALARWALRWRRTAKSLRPRFGRIELMVARAQLGYANTLLYQRALAGVSGQRLNPIFEARQVAGDAEERVRLLGADVPGQRKTEFEAFVTQANVLQALESSDEAARYLERARALDPFRAEQDPMYLYVRGSVAARPAQFLQRAVEHDPFFDVAQFKLAVAIEMIWRRRPTIEESVATIVADAYERVLALNPANIAAWANLGYVYWLLAGPDAKTETMLALAKRALQRGREYKEIRPETFVAELDYGLARIAAESGDFAQAYRHYINAVTAQVAQGVSHDPDGFTNYHFAYMTRAVLDRFEKYSERVRAEWEQQQALPQTASNRLSDSVYAFVLNDFGEANMNYFLRCGDTTYLDRARGALLGAKKNLGTRYPMISYNLNRLERWQQTNVADLNDDEIADPEREQAVLLDASHIEDVLQYEPHWEDAMLEQAISYAGRTVQARAFAERLDELALRSDRRKHGAGAGGVPPNDAYDPLEHWTSFHAEAARISERPAGSSILPAGAPDRAHGLPAPEPPMPLPLASPVVLISGEKESGETAEPQEDEGRQLRRRARKLREDAVRHETAARRLVRSLLPQPWLKKIDGDLDLAAIDREDIESLRRWQRELDDLHVKALLAWCKILATRPGPQMNREAARLLKHLQEQFRPDDFDVLLECRGCPGFSTSERRRYAQRLATVLRQWIAQDTSWMSLSWVEPDPHNPPDLFTPDERVALYARAASEKHLPDDVYFWLGDCLHELGRDDAGHLAYAHVLASQDPQALVRVGERFQSLDRWAESLQAYESARSLDPDESLENADFYRRLIGRALWKVNAYEGAVREFGATTDSSELGDSWRTTLVEELLRDMSVESPHRYRLLKRWLGQQLVTAQVDNRPLARQDAAEAILLLTKTRYHRLVRRGEEAPTENEPMLPLASPMLIEADPGFFPDGAQTEQVKRILEQEIPELRRVIAASFGISLPGVRIMPSLDSGSSAYRLAIDEIPIEEGHFENQEQWFVPDPQLANANLAGSVGVDPLTGRSGLWLANEPLPAADGWDRYGHIIRHLHAIVVAHLNRFLGVQELEQMLNDWTSNGPPERWDLRAGALPDERARLRLVAVSRLLAAERVPLTDFTPILRALARADEAAEAAAIAESIRAELRPILPGVDGHGPIRTLPPLLEDRIQALLHVAAGKRFLAAPPGEIDTLRTAIGNHLGPDKRTPVVVLTPGLRPFVRRLLALDYTGVSVLARSELPDLRLPVSSDTGAQTLVEAQR